MELPKLSTINARHEQELRDWFVEGVVHKSAYQVPEESPRTADFPSQYYERLPAIDDYPATADFATVSTMRDTARTQFDGRDPAEVARDDLHNEEQTASALDWATNFVPRQLVHLPRRDEADNLHPTMVQDIGIQPNFAKALAPQEPKKLAETVGIARHRGRARLIDRRQPLSGRSPDEEGSVQQFINAVGDDKEVDSVCEEVDDEEVDDDLEAVDLYNTQCEYVRRREPKTARLSREKCCERRVGRGHIAKHCPERQPTTTRRKVEDG